MIYLLTGKSSRSTFTFHELALAEWFEKSIVTVYIENVWTNMRSSIRALLGIEKKNHNFLSFIGEIFHSN